MAEEHLLERVRREIRERLEETESLIRERERLQRALHALEDVPEPPPAPRAARRPRPRRAPAGRRAPRGQRREELLQLVKGSPSLSVSEAARQIGISPSQAFTLVRRLEEEGVLRREDGRLILVAPAASQARGRKEPGVATAGAASSGTEPTIAAAEPAAPSVRSVASAEGEVGSRAMPASEPWPSEPVPQASEEALMGADAAAESVPSDEGAGLGSAEGSTASATPAVTEAPPFGDDRPRGPAAADEGATAPPDEA